MKATWDHSAALQEWVEIKRIENLLNFLDNVCRSYLWKEEWQDDKADPVDDAGKLKSIGDCWESRREEHEDETSKAWQVVCNFYVYG